MNVTEFYLNLVLCFEKIFSVDDLADGSLQDFVIIKLETQECLQTTLRTSAALSKVKLETETQFLKDQSMW